MLRSHYKLKVLDDYNVLIRTIKTHDIQYYPRKEDLNEKTISNMARAKRVLKDVLNNNLTPESSFLTLTYADNVQDYDRFYKDFMLFILRLKRLGIKLKYAGVKELQQRGAIHAHIVIFNSLQDFDFSKIWTFGFVYHTPINDFDSTTANKISNYMVKYLINQDKGQLIAKDKKMYFTSRDCIRTTNIKISKIDFLEMKEYAKIIIDQLTQEYIYLEKSSPYLELFFKQ